MPHRAGIGDDSQTYDARNSDMAETNSVARSLHDLGLAAWFGGSLMGAVGVNGASEEVADPKDRIRVANAGWGRWTPVNLVAIVLHFIGGLQLIRGNRGRIAGQQGVARTTALKTGVTLAAAGATAYSRILGQKVMDAEADAARHTPTEGGLEASSAVEPGPTTPEDVAKAQRQLRIFQWVIPLLTGIVLIINARMGEQQRPQSVTEGLLERLTSGRKAA
jgi:hypothetical protein